MDVSKHHKSVFVVAFVALLVQAGLNVYVLVTLIFESFNERVIGGLSLPPSLRMPFKLDFLHSLIFFADMPNGHQETLVSAIKNEKF